MYILDLSLATALLSISIITSALPLNPLNPPSHEVHQPLQARASYSVVPVDGGSTTAAPIFSTTVFATVTDSIIDTAFITTPPSTETVISIETVEASSPPPTTVSITVSIPLVEPTETIIIVASQSASSGPTSTTIFSSPPITTPLASTTISIITSNFTLSSIATSTVSAQSTSTSTFHTYDNGQWHTTYPSWNATIMSKFIMTGSISSTYVSAPSGEPLKR
ncbi:MAG: hypothetical protein MMC33_000527 [Icmadophila ericetorum]|nr:hypothetical protein [Icmadophila ericetorum]